MFECVQRDRTFQISRFQISNCRNRSHGTLLIVSKTRDFGLHLRRRGKREGRSGLSVSEWLAGSTFEILKLGENLPLCQK